MRGGERVLEAILEICPNATIYTLFHQRGKVSKFIESHRIFTSRLDRIPGIYRYYRNLLPLFPSAVAAWDLSGFDLSQADLRGADLRGTNFSQATLSGAHLEGANLFKAVLDDADLEGAFLRGAQFLNCAQLVVTRNWQSAFRDDALACGAAIPERKPSK